MKAPLTPKQERFVEEYLLDLNATQAAIRAGYSSKGARQQGAENLSKPYIRKEISLASHKRSSRLAWDIDRLLQRLVDDLEADMAELFDGNGQLKPVKEWPAPFRCGLVVSAVVEEIWEGAGSSLRQTGCRYILKFADRTQRLELLMKHLSMSELPN
jgi:phage terminase small subunit